MSFIAFAYRGRVLNTVAWSLIESASDSYERTLVPPIVVHVEVTVLFTVPQIMPK